MKELIDSKIICIKCLPDDHPNTCVKDKYGNILFFSWWCGKINKKIRSNMPVPSNCPYALEHLIHSQTPLKK